MRRVLIPFVAVLLVAAAMLFQANAPAPTLAPAPSVALGEIAGYASVTGGVTEAERTILPADTQIARRLYRNAAGEVFVVSLVIGGRSKSSIHRPDLCLPAQGFLLSNARTVSLAGRDWRLLDLTRAEGGAATYAYAYFNQDGFWTVSPVARILRDTLVRSFRGRIDRWSLVTVMTSVRDPAALARFFAEFVPSAIAR